MPLFSRTAAREEQRRRQSLWENGRTMVYAVALALVVRSLFFEPFHIPSGSMRATLLEGDYIFVTKFSYGYSRYSFPFGARIGYFDGRVFGRLPERGDVAVFRLPSNTKIDYIKRIMALPGDRIQVKQGRVWLNGRQLDYEKTGDFVFKEGERAARAVAQYIETLPSGETHTVLDETSYGNVDNTREVTVPDGHVFVMGDNRDNSVDSRYMHEVGFVPLENMLGRADLILFSLNKGVDIPFWAFWRYPELFRDGRFFKDID